MCRWYHSNGKMWRGTKEPLDEGERGEWKSWLKTQHSKNSKNSWHLVPSLHGKYKGKEWKQWQILYSWAPKSLPMVTTSHEIKKTLAPWKKSHDKSKQHIHSKDITLPTKIYIVKAMVFPVVVYGCESWTIKKAEHQRIDAFALCCWRRLLRTPWTARRSNQSILKEINTEYSLEGRRLELKLQHFGHLMWRVDSTEKTLMLGKIESRGWDGYIASWTQWTWIWANSRK